MMEGATVTACSTEVPRLIMYRSMLGSSPAVSMCSYTVRSRPSTKKMTALRGAMAVLSSTRRTGARRPHPADKSATATVSAMTWVPGACVCDVGCASGGDRCRGQAGCLADWRGVSHFFIYNSVVLTFNVGQLLFLAGRSACGVLRCCIMYCRALAVFVKVVVICGCRCGGDCPAGAWRR